MRSFILLAVLGGCAAGPLEDLAVVDTHVHFWDVDDPNGIAWPPAGHPLHRSILPKDFAPVAAENRVAAVVVVQSGSRLYENGWTLKATEGEAGRYAGVVGNLSPLLGTEAFERVFEELCRDPRYVGFRLSNQPPDFGNDAVWRHLKLVADRGKTLDVLMVSYRMEDVRRIASRLPSLRVMMNHGTGIRVDGGPADPAWRAELKATAAHPNVYCKVSGLFDKAKTRPAPKEVGYYRPNLDALWEAFGEDRLVFGSDWPVTELDGSYRDYKGMILDYFRPKGPEVCRKVFERNALRFYGLPPLGR